MEKSFNLIGSKEERYEALIPQLKSLISTETDQIANYANVSAALKEVFDFLWVGFYRVSNKVLVLGPFQGPIACSRIAFGKGVCGFAWQEGKTVIVPDVDQFPGHIACSSRSKSEIVVPVVKEAKILAVLDVDSELLNNFDEIDAKYLEIICALLS